MAKIVGIIPAHLASVRFPRKILFPFSGMPMIEHVRRRALLADQLSGVYVATCDDEIAEAVEAYGCSVIRTGDHHQNGTSRIAEAVKSIDCTHVILLQGDEPLLLPRHVDRLADSISDFPEADAWNVTGPIDHPDELDRHSFVKCAVGADNRILYCFRRSPSILSFENQTSYIRKILGLFAFEREYLLEIADAPRSVVERYESIEQMRIVESGGHLVSVPVDESMPSVNEPYEVDAVLESMKTDPEQLKLLNGILGQ